MSGCYSLSALGMGAWLAASEPALVFHWIHCRLTPSCTGPERSRCHSWSDTWFRWGTALNFNGLWVQGALGQVLGEACVLQWDQKPACTSQHGRSLNARQNQEHKRHSSSCLHLWCQTQLLISNFTLIEIIYVSEKYWSPLLSFPFPRFSVRKI